MVLEQSLNQLDPWFARVAIAQAFARLAPVFIEDEIVPFFDFLVNGGALGDTSVDVRRAMLDAGGAVIDMQGQLRLPQLIGMFEEYLTKPTPPTETTDRIKEAVVILFGRAARHLQSSDPRVKAVVDRLVEALKTPSELVQSAVSDCLPPLVVLIPSETSRLVDQLLANMVGAPKYAERRGAAYGLAGLIKGCGLKSIKQYNIVSRLRTAIDDKKNYEARQGALFGLETLASTLGRLFEPYLIELLTLLLSTYGDQVPDVREATQDTSKVMMAHLSGLVPHNSIRPFFMFIFCF